MNKLDVVLGLQWGDEGKGKVVDVLTPNYGTIARFQGGPNAGHSLVFDGDSFVLHTVPSGIFRDDTLNIIGNGVVIDRENLIPGDLVFFNTISDSDLSDHAGVYLGEGYFIHASSGAHKVVVSNLNTGYYGRVFSWGRRILK